MSNATVINAWESDRMVELEDDLMAGGIPGADARCG
jgi:hypothetical protein